MTRWPPPPRLSARFYKGHGLGNDYLVFAEGTAWVATPSNVRRVCDRFRGVGGDGIVVRLDAAPEEATVALRMFNPDGGEFERSGNGLRVLASCLARRDPHLRALDVEVGGERVRMEVHGRDGPVHDISVDMGRALVGPEAVHGAVDAFVPEDGVWGMAGPEGTRVRVVPVSVGNPHLVVLAAAGDTFSEEWLGELGPFLAGHRALTRGANVQLARVSTSGGAEAFIWERGVGRTSASGTSACAVAVALVASGLARPGPVPVSMPGGILDTTVSHGLDVTLRGPVEEVLEGELTPSFVATFERAP